MDTSSWRSRESFATNGAVSVPWAEETNMAPIDLGSTAALPEAGPPMAPGQPEDRAPRDRNAELVLLYHYLLPED